MAARMLTRLVGTCVDDGMSQQAKVQGYTSVDNGASLQTKQQDCTPVDGGVSLASKIHDCTSVDDGESPQTKQQDCTSVDGGAAAQTRVQDCTSVDNGESPQTKQQDCTSVDGALPQTKVQECTSVDNGVAPQTKVQECQCEGSGERDAESKPLLNTTSGESGQLFELFVLDQIKKQNISSTPFISMELSYTGEMTSELFNAASRLGELAAEFSGSEERKMVKEAALTVSAHMMRQELATALTAMLCEAPSLDEGVLVLFFFCLDLSVRIIESEMNPELLEVIGWVKDAINSALGPYVEKHGGWTKVGSTAARYIATGMSVLTKLRGFAFI